MKIYKHGTKDRHATVFVSPGTDYPDKPEWMQKVNDGTGKMVNKPIQFTVQFLNGVAEVDNELGRYMLDHQMAKDSPIAEPEVEAPLQFNPIRTPVMFNS